MALDVKKKVGPLPLWVWVAAGGVAVIGYIYLRRSSGAGGESLAAGPVELVTGNVQPQDYAASGYPSTNGAPASGLAPEVLQAVMDQGLIRQDITELRGQLAEVTGSLEAAGWSQSYSFLPPATATEAVAASTLGAPGAAPQRTTAVARGKAKTVKPPPKRKPAAAVRYSTYRKQVKIHPGQKLKFRKGRGYYAA